MVEQMWLDFKKTYQILYTSSLWDNMDFFLNRSKYQKDL